MTDFNYRPSFMCTLTLKLDENAIAIPQEIQQAMAIPGVIPTLHAKYLKAKYEFSDVAISRRIQPSNVTIIRNSHMTADEADISIPYISIPFSPKLIKSAIVQVFGGAISNQDYARGIRNLAVDEDAMTEPLSMIKQVRSAELFAGVVDTIRKEGFGKGSTISLKCRDLTQILIDAKVPTGLLNNLPDLNMRLDVWIKELISNHPIARTVFDNVVYDGNHYENTALSSEGVPVAKTSGKGKRRKRPKIFTGMSYWDLIVDVSVGAGYIPNVSGTLIKLRLARTFYDKEHWQDSRFKRVIDGKESHIRRLEIGRNVKNYTFERKLGVSSTPIIKVVTAIEGKTIAVTYPSEDPTKQLAYNKAGDQAENKILVVPIGGTRNKKVMKDLARMIWEKVARQEFTCEVSTDSMFSSGGSWRDPDLLYLNPSDAIELVELDVRDYVSENTNKARTFKILRDRLGVGQSADDELFLAAAEIAISEVTNSEIMRVASVTHNFSVSGAYSCVINIHNWYEVVLGMLDKNKFEEFGVDFGAPDIETADPPDGGIE